MEIKFAKDMLDNIQLQTKEKIPLTGLDVWFSSIAMNIAFKEEYLKSDKDMEDARHLRMVYSDKINEKVNINTSTQAQLESLSGVGPVTASKIITGRPYASIEELLGKKIVGKAVYEKIKDFIVSY